MDEFIEKQLGDRWWRLNHLYWILNKEGELERFKPNWAQKQLHEEMHYRNDVLKVRQLGISTYTSLLILDVCLFERDKHCGIIDKSIKDAKGKIEKIRFAYDHLDHIPPNPTTEDIYLAKLGRMIKSEKTAKIGMDSAAFSTGGKIDAGTSLRGGTFQLLHISELAYVAAHAPIKAKEIVTGGINAVSKKSVIIRESTHEGGKWGINYEMTKKSMEMVGKKLSNLDWKFFFFSWVNQQEYRLEESDPPDDPDLLKYFDTLEQVHNIVLDDAQKAWYASMYRSFGYAIWQEYPTVPEEAFQTQVDGAIYGKFISMLRSRGHLNAEYEVDPLAPLYVSWDIGMSDYMALWFWQLKGDGKYYVVDCLTANDKSLEWYVGYIRNWEGKYGAIHKHLLPHDAARRDWEGVSFESKLIQAGFSCSIVPRTPDVWAGIFAVRRLLPYCVFHERCSRTGKIDGTEYMSGLNALENYQKAPISANGEERESPLHNKCSHAADGFRTFAEAVEAGLVGKAGSVTQNTEYEQGSCRGLARGADALFI